MFYSTRNLTEFTDCVMLAAYEATPFTPVRSYLMYLRHYVFGDTLADLARASGLSRERIRVIISRMDRPMRRLLTDSGVVSMTEDSFRKIKIQ